MRTRTKRIVALLAGTAMLGSSFASFAATDVAPMIWLTKESLRSCITPPPKSPKETADLMDSVPYFRHGMSSSGHHPDPDVLANAEYKTQIATLAAAGVPSDVFLLQGMNTKDWAKQGLLLDLTDYIKHLLIMMSTSRTTSHRSQTAIPFMATRY